MISLMTPLFVKMHLLDMVDIVLVAILLYEIYRLIRGTAAINIFIGIIAIYLFWKLVRMLQMDLLGEILGQFISVGVIALIVVFQPEIRRFLLLVGTPGFLQKTPRRFLFWKIKMASISKLDAEIIVNSCQSMSNSKTGALIVIAKQDELRQYTSTGEIIEAKLSEALIQHIFYKNTPLHDGALIVVGNRIKAVKCILPVSSNFNLPRRLGLRHRAAVGITEQSDAIAIVVSEETGYISYCKSGEITMHVQADQLKDFLKHEF